jgi:hypothetical protein
MNTMTAPQSAIRSFRLSLLMNIWAMRFPPSILD